MGADGRHSDRNPCGVTYRRPSQSGIREKALIVTSGAQYLHDRDSNTIAGPVVKVGGYLPSS